MFECCWCSMERLRADCSVDKALRHTMPRHRQHRVKRSIIYLVCVSFHQLCLCIESRKYATSVVWVSLFLWHDCAMCECFTWSCFIPIFTCDGDANAVWSPPTATVLGAVESSARGIHDGSVSWIAARWTFDAEQTHVSLVVLDFRSLL